MGLISYFQEKREGGIFREIPLDSRGRLYTSPMPSGAYDRGIGLLRIYGKHRINHVFPLVTDGELEKKARLKLLGEYEKRGITFSRYIIGDYQAPSQETLKALVEEAVQRLNRGERVAVHCHAGVGRTSLAVACIVMAVNHMNADEAVAHVKDHMIVNITNEQTRRIREFEHIGTPSRGLSE